MNVIFEADPAEIDRRLADEDALDVLVIDDARIPTATHFDTFVLEEAARAQATELAISERAAVRSGAEAWAHILRRGRPDIAYVPTATSYAQVWLAIGLADRDVRVVVGTTREAFLTLADDPSVREKLWA